MYEKAVMKGLAPLVALASLGACGSNEQEPTPSPEAFGTTTTLDVSELPGELGRIAFVSDETGDTEIYIEDLEAGERANVTNNPAGDWNPQTDGEYIVFFSDRDGDTEIYSFPIDNPTEVTQLTDNDARDYDPIFTPGGDIIYGSNEDDGYGDIKRMKADGSNKQNLTPSLPDTEEWKPEVVLDAEGSERIIFTSRQEEGYPDSDEIFALDTETGAITQFTDNPVADWYIEADPAGQNVAYVSDDQQDTPSPDRIYTMRPDGTNRTKLMDSQARDKDGQVMTGDWADPSYSLDGEQVLFVYNHGEPEDTYDIYAMDRDGTDVKEVVGTPGDDLSPIALPL